MSNIDEFGRDLSLRNKEENESLSKENYQSVCEFMTELIKKYAGMSWAEISFQEEEEEEEEERRKIEQEKQKVLEERRYLYSIGEYELEEGEILE